MNAKELNAEQLIKAQQKANKASQKMIRVLGLEDLVVRNNKLIKIHTDGREEVVRDSKFKSVKINSGIFQIKGE
ncbi:hypothetical protein JYB64_09095 [Algoriphagus aestuarii]|nr:hypothetical protein [Algoriphagus aestuarii]